ETRERYALFLTVQHQFHRDIDALYSNPALDRLLPDLAGRRRFGDVEQDLGDLAVAVPAAATTPAFDGNADIPTALGWLYVAEGSNLGAAFLIKEAAKLGLSETFGARHLAGAPEGRGLHWKTFTAALDSVDLDEDEEARMIEGARAAFRRVHGLVTDVFA
ncbi:biliverdin-producing heme oxygenase, partial [Kaistia terrae]